PVGGRADHVARAVAWAAFERYAAAGDKVVGLGLGQVALLSERHVHPAVTGGVDTPVDHGRRGDDGVGVSDDDDVRPTVLSGTDGGVAGGRQVVRVVVGVDFDDRVAGKVLVPPCPHVVVRTDTAGLRPPRHADDDLHPATVSPATTASTARANRPPPAVSRSALTRASARSEAAA